jgi:hypothetical protein
MRSLRFLILGSLALLVAVAPGTADAAGSRSARRTASTGTTAALPVVAVGEWRMLALQGGMFLARQAAGSGDTAFVYGSDGGDRKAALQLQAYAGTDLAQAASGLAGQLSAADAKTLDAFVAALGWKGDSAAGKWSALSSDGALALVASSDVGIFGPLLKAALAVSGSSSTATVSVGYCKAASLIDPEGTALVVKALTATGGALATPENTIAFEQATAAACADVIPSYPPPATTPPAFPVYPPPATPPPGWTPPTGPGSPVWVGGTCTAFGVSSQCVNRDGELCSCTCEGAGDTGIWQSHGTCKAIPSTTPGSAGPPPVPGSPCAPPGGIGPCGTGSACNCNPPPAGSPPGTPGTWGPPLPTGDAATAGGFVLITALLGFGLARRPRRAPAPR